MNQSTFIPIITGLALIAVAPVQAQDSGAPSDEELAKKLANPISSMISVPFDFGFNTGLGPDDGDNITLAIQPVIPFSLSDDFSLVVRTIVPVVWQNDVAGPSGSQFGLSDTLQSFFLVPESDETALGTLTYGVGPAVLWPTSTDSLLGAGTLGAGLTAVALIQKGGWTYGALTNHITGIHDTRSSAGDLDSTFLQPFLVYTTANAWSYVLQSETSYDWDSNEWSVPINVFVNKLTTFGGQKIQLQAGIRYWSESPENGPEDFGTSFKITFLF
ncbi:hypothetical protein [Rubritalea profundi]|uniref:Transporter n=1 Tax=Rubritalea profundi TaxID=1658618 RepID=A0A2S7U1K6_9BACT|nr:hypothetical protein [Rubritalea profundi]PQJ28470.1 hypothetical protein BSZ32_08060 [Rubritalea profundi]